MAITQAAVLKVRLAVDCDIISFLNNASNWIQYANSKLMMLLFLNKLKRQYKKNINRTLEVKLKDNAKIQGVLKNVQEDYIALEWKTREPKTIGKGKLTVVKNTTIPFSDIREAKVKIIF